MTDPFDAVEALELASEKSGGPLIQASIARRYFDVARACAKIMALALGTGEVFGDAAASPVLKALSDAIRSIENEVSAPFLRFIALMPQFVSASAD